MITASSKPIDKQFVLCMLFTNKMPEFREQNFGDEIDMVTNSYGSLPLSHTLMDEDLRTKPTPDTVLAMVIDALVKSKPIPHKLAQSTVAGLIENDYHNIDRLSGTSWEERTDLLEQVGYSRYRGLCATNLGDLSDFVLVKYGTKLWSDTFPAISRHQHHTLRWRPQQSPRCCPRGLRGSPKQNKGD